MTTESILSASFAVIAALFAASVALLASELKAAVQRRFRRRVRRRTSRWVCGVKTSAPTILEADTKTDEG
jgi:hypothetical protein